MIVNRYDMMFLFYRDKVECDMTFLGLIVMQNKLKRETKPVIKTLLAANLRCVMITGKIRNFQIPPLLLCPHFKGKDGLKDKVSASQPRDCGFEPHTGHDYDSSYETG